jgi:predicted nuclease of restriction endonuclease-like (RecB) superfamily
LIIGHTKDPKEREFYLKMTAKHGWSKYELQRQLKQDSYKRWMLNQQNFIDTVDENRIIEATLAVKDDYNFDFLGVEGLPSERALENALIDNILDFLKEMGSDFTFVGRQHKLVVSEDEYYVDLLFFHRRLKSLIAVELKTDEFRPEYAGKMQFYLSALDELTKIDGENPSIGIIICKTKDRTKVEYTLKDIKRPVGVASYNQYENLEDIPEKIAKYLPDEDELEKRLGVI